MPSYLYLDIISFFCKQIVQQQFNFANFKIKNNIKNMMFYKDYEKKLQGFLPNKKKRGLH